MVGRRLANHRQIKKKSPEAEAGETVIDAGNPWVEESAALFERFKSELPDDQTFSSGVNPQSAIQYLQSVCLPATVSVGFSTNGGNCCPGGGGGFPACAINEIYSLETYCKRVVPNEWVASWSQPQAFRAAAVAVRSYTINKINFPTYNGYDICSSPCCQNFGNMNSVTSAAVDFTAGYVLQLASGTVAATEYSAENNHLLPTCAGNNSGMGCSDGKFFWAGTCYADPVGTGKNLYGHGRGMSQRGSARWASGRNMNTCSNTLQQSQHGQGMKTWDQILALYYPTLTLVNCAPPANDACAAATELTSYADTCVFTAGTALNASASPGFGIPTCSGYTSIVANDVWYRFTAEQPEHTITVDPQGAEFSNQYVDPVIAVYTGCTDASLLQCEDDTGGGGGDCAMTVGGLTPGQTYYVRVFDYGGQVAPVYHDFDICLSHTLPELLPNLTAPPVAPTVGIAANLLSLNAAVLNNGQAEAPASVAVFYLSADPSFSTLDYIVGVDTLPAIAPGQTTAIATVIDLCQTGVPNGDYYLAYSIDDLGDVAESDEEDNFWPAGPVTVECALTGTETAIDADGLRVYPNPAHDAVTVEVGADAYIGEMLQIYNSLGQVVAEQRITHRSSVVELGQLPAGYYVLTLQAGTGMVARPLVVRR